MNYKDKILIQKITHSEEDVKKSVMILIIGLIITNIFGLMTVTCAFFEFEELNIIFLLSAVTSILISIIVVKLQDVYTDIGRMHNKIIVECATNNELNENNENNKE